MPDPVDKATDKAQEPWQPKRRHLWAMRVSWLNAGYNLLIGTGLGALAVKVLGC